MKKKNSQLVAQDTEKMLDVLAAMWPGQEEYMKTVMATKLSEHYGERWRDKEHCINCGALMRQYTFRHTKLSCSLLRKMANEVEASMAKGKSFSEANIVHIPSTRTLTSNEADAKTILRYLGLIAKYKKDKSQVKGMWVITSWGWSFLRGEPVLDEVTVWRKVIVERSQSTVTMREVFAGEAGDYEESHYTYSIQSGIL